MRARFLPLLVACMAFSPSRFCPAANSSPGSTPAQRETSPTHVLGFAAGDHFDQAEAVTRALKKSIEHSTNQKLAGGEFSLEVLTAALGCPEKPDNACLKKIANKIGSQRFLWGTMEIDGQRVEAELHLHTDDISDRKVKFSYQASMTDTMDADLLGITANAVSQLLGPLRYRVVVRSNEQTGTLSIDGKDVGTLFRGEATLEIPSGDHQFRLKPQGTSGKGADKSIAEQTARVHIAELTKIRLDIAPGGSANMTSTPSMTARPEAPGDQPAAPLDRGVASNTTSTSDPQRTWGYITLAAGGLFLIGGTAAAIDLYALNHKDNFQRYRDALMPSQDACTMARGNHEVPGAMTPAGVRSLCRDAERLELAEIVLLASGVVAAGTGLTLLLTSKSTTETARRTIVPHVVLGRDRTDVSVTLRF